MTSLHDGFTVVIECHMCNTEHEIHVSEEDYWRWANRTPVQIAFPYLTADQREMFILRPVVLAGTLCLEMSDYTE